MNRERDLKAVLDESLALARVDTRHLMLEIAAGHLTIHGSVHSLEQQDCLMDVLRNRSTEIGSLDCDIGIENGADFVPLNR